MGGASRQNTDAASRPTTEPAAGTRRSRLRQDGARASASHDGACSGAYAAGTYIEARGAYADRIYPEPDAAAGAHDEARGAYAGAYTAGTYIEARGEYADGIYTEPYAAAGAHDEARGAITLN